MSSLLAVDFDELTEGLVQNDYPKYKAESIANWIYQKAVFDFEEMTDLSKTMRAELQKHHHVLDLKQKALQEGSSGRTFKFLLETHDSLQIEAVLMVNDDPEERMTACISSQVGCALQCAFCATGRLGFTRDLTTAEIISQVLILDRFARDHFQLDTKKRALTNIVFMGMGEPLLNYDAVVQAVNILNHQKTYNLGKRHITISTAGIAPRIEQLAKDLDQVRLAISLNSSHQDKRKVIMPVSSKYNIKSLLHSVKVYQEICNRRVTFEYVLIQGINDDEKDVLDMKRALYKIKYNLNLIPFNETDDSPFQRPDRQSLKNFRGYLKKHGIPFVERYSRGQDIDAACGQLALKDRNRN